MSMQTNFDKVLFTANKFSNTPNLLINNERYCLLAILASSLCIDEGLYQIDETVEQLKALIISKFDTQYFYDMFDIDRALEYENPEHINAFSDYLNSYVFEVAYSQGYGCNMGYLHDIHHPDRITECFLNGPLQDFTIDDFWAHVDNIGIVHHVAAARNILYLIDNPVPTRKDIASRELDQFIREKLSLYSALWTEVSNHDFDFPSVFKLYNEVYNEGFKVWMNYTDISNIRMKRHENYVENIITGDTYGYNPILLDRFSAALREYMV